MAQVRRYGWLVRFPDPLKFTPSYLNHLFGPAISFAPKVQVEYRREVELYIWACPRQFSLSNVTRQRADLSAINHPLSPRPLEMHILTPDLTYAEQLVEAKIGVIGYDLKKDAVFVP